MPIDIEKDDVTTALKKLKAREATLRQLEKVAGLGSWEVDLTTNKSIWSEKSYEIYQVPKDEPVGLDTFFSMLLDEYKEAAHQTIKKALKTKKAVSFSCKIKRRDGKIIDVLINAQIIFDKKNKPLKMIGTTQDITQWVSLQRHTQELSALIEYSSNEVYVVDMQTLQFIYVNKGACDALQYSREELLSMSVQDINPYLSTKELERLKSLLLATDYMLNRTIHQRKDGSLYHVQSYIHQLQFEGKEAYVIFDTDISGMIELDLEYKKQAKVLAHIHDSVIATNTYGKITSWNQGSTKLFGYDAQEIMGKSVEILYSKNNKQSLFSLFSSLNHAQDNIDTEVLMLTKANKEIICDISLSLLKNDLGEVEGYVGYIQDITQQKKTQQLLEEQTQKLTFQAHHDLLTSLPNRTLFQERLSQAIVSSKRHKEIFALMFIDLDQFKKINDSLGHHIGDAVLIEASKRLRASIREEDTLARLGGDEFTVIVKNIKEAKNAAIVANKIIAAIKEPMVVESHTLHISTSIGISIYPDDTKSEQDLIKYADTAMYKAKENGRDNYQFYSSEMTDEALLRVLIENSLRTAIAEKEFIVYFQPQYNALTQTLEGMEALVRWNHPHQGMIPPGVFIPIAEDTGLITQVDALVYQEAMQQFVTWYEQGLNPGKLSLNLSMKQLAKDDFVQNLTNMMAKLHFHPSWLELEVTEGDIMKNPESSIKKLFNISALGIDLAIDDFGTGYSSLSYLKKLPLDKLKIDQSFVRGLPDDEDDQAITKAIIALGKSLKLKLIAEGVEEKAQEDFLVANGCNLIQGYYHSKPRPAEEIERLLHT